MPENKMGNVLLVHCVDTEGPLYESVSATFERVENTFGLKFTASREQLSRLQQGLDTPDHLKEAVMEFLSEDRLRYNTSWTEVDNMLHGMMAEDWRMRYADDYGNGYVFSWYILDLLGAESNPRRKALGFHAIYEHYRDILAEHGNTADKLYWHNHPVSFFFEANKTSNNFSFTNHHVQSISRRIIDHLDFPASYRPGCHCERPDINLFLEMWIPFDYANQGMPERAEDSLQKDIGGGRYGDWRRATSEWETYHPDWYDYQAKGNMKRYISRCLNLDARLRPITREEIVCAFERAASGKDTIMAVCNHDCREMRHHIDRYMQTVREVQQGFEGVRIRHMNAVDAVRMSERLPQEEPTRLDFSWEGPRLHVKADKPVWGPQPWFCFKTGDKRYIHENFDFQDGLHWTYDFDEDTVTLDQIESIGVATNDNYGNSSIYRLTNDRDLEKTKSAFRNI
jgi:hypothetical protein